MALQAQAHMLASGLSASKPSKTLLPIQIQSLSVKTRPTLGLAVGSPLSLAISSPTKINTNHTRRCFFKSFAAAPDSTPTDDVQPSESQINQEEPSSLESLIIVYKQAILDGDLKAVADIEARIKVVENEKNRLVQELSEISEEMKSGKEKYVRLQADFDNFRKRTEKERVTIRSDAQGEVIENLLPMVDSFERARQQIKPDTEKEKKIDASYQGIYKQLVEIMRSLKVAAVATVGKPFDPSLHEAIAREESQEFGEGIIIQEFRRGFLLGDRLLRPAMVKVSAGPGSKKAQVTTDKSTGQPATAASVDER